MTMSSMFVILSMVIVMVFKYIIAYIINFRNLMNSPQHSGRLSVGECVLFSRQTTTTPTAQVIKTRAQRLAGHLPASVKPKIADSNPLLSGSGISTNNEQISQASRQSVDPIDKGATPEVVAPPVMGKNVGTSMGSGDCLENVEKKSTGSAR